MLTTRNFRCMTTEVELLVASEDVQDAEEAMAEVEAFFQSVDARFSRFRPDSELSVLNAASGTTAEVSEDMADLVENALAAAEMSHGVFDPSIIDALEAAGYDRSIDLIRAGGTQVHATAPSPSGKWSRIMVDRARRTVTLPAGTRLDLGGIGKGWAVDRAAAMLKALGPGLVDAGGDMRAWGDQPGIDEGDGWLVAVDHPMQPGTDIAWLKVRDASAATSSVVTRRWAGGHHLIDPRSGKPADTDLLSVTVVAPSTMQAEVAAKVALIQGKDAGLAWLERQSGVEALLAGADGSYYGTSGITRFLFDDNKEQ